jgi:hypothetical protein
VKLGWLDCFNHRRLFGLWAGSHPLNSKRRTGRVRRKRLASRNSSKRFSGKAGAIHGKVAGEYVFEESLASDEEGYPHQRSVRWIRPMIDRSRVEGELRGPLEQQGVTIMALHGGILRRIAEQESWI